MMQERLDLVVAGDTDGSLGDWDISTNRMYYSALWKASLGYEEWEPLIHPPNGKPSRIPRTSRVLALADDYLSDRVASHELEHRLRHKDGTGHRWIHTVAVLQRDPKGVLADDRSHVDITKRKQAEQALSQSESTLKGSSRGRVDDGESCGSG